MQKAVQSQGMERFEVRLKIIKTQNKTGQSDLHMVILRNWEKSVSLRGFASAS